MTKEEYINNYLKSSIKQFQYYYSLAERSMAQLSDQEWYFKPEPDSNSIAILVKHISGNMLSRWTDFLTTDGEKEWRNREREFEEDDLNNIKHQWDEGWNCLFDSLKNLQLDDFDRLVYIRNMGHTITEAINRQLCHYAYHVGQIVYLCKQIKKQEWQVLSIPKGNSEAYNQKKFNIQKHRGHFLDEL